MSTARCTATAGPDRCESSYGHDGDHRTHWTPIVIMTWRGDEAWAHDLERYV